MHGRAIRTGGLGPPPAGDARRLPPRPGAAAARVLLAVALFAAQAGPVLAQPDTQSDAGPDAALDACLHRSEAASSAGQARCLSDADRRWSDRLDRAYRRLLAQLDAPSRRLLERSQRAWTEFRAADLAFLQGPWRAGQGTYASAQLAELRLAGLRARVLALEGDLPP